MAVTIETETIPAQTISTAVVTIPADEWRNMRYKEGTLEGIFVLLGLACAFGFLMYMGIFPLILERDYGIVANDIGDALMLCLPIVAIAFPVIYGFRRLLRASERIRPNLLKKHGWDGTSRYRVKLEYQIFLHD